MQAHIMDSGLENWHDFEVESRREIIALLRSISEKNQLIRMLIHGESDVCVTSILEVDAERMRRNLDLTQGLVLAEAVSIVLAQRLGRDRAHHLLEHCCQRAVAEQRHLLAVLGDEPQVSAELSAEELDRLLDPAHYLGQARVWVARAVSEHQHFTA